MPCNVLYTYLGNNTCLNEVVPAICEQGDVFGPDVGADLMRSDLTSNALGFFSSLLESSKSWLGLLALGIAMSWNSGRPAPRIEKGFPQSIIRHQSERSDSCSRHAALKLD